MPIGSITAQKYLFSSSGNVIDWNLPHFHRISRTDKTARHNFCFTFIFQNAEKNFFGSSQRFFVDAQCLILGNDSSPPPLQIAVWDREFPFIFRFNISNSRFGFSGYHQLLHFPEAAFRKQDCSLFYFPKSEKLNSRWPFLQGNPLQLFFSRANCSVIFPFPVGKNKTKIRCQKVFIFPPTRLGHSLEKMLIYPALNAAVRVSFYPDWILSDAAFRFIFQASFFVFS